MKAAIEALEREQAAIWHLAGLELEKAFEAMAVRGKSEAIDQAVRQLAAIAQ